MLDCRKKKDDAVENKYLFQITKRWTVDGSVRKNIARYINHACKPNAESDVSKKKLRIVIRAIKDIQPGDEINYDYGTEYFKEFLKPIGCKCDSCEAKRKKKRAVLRVEKAALKAKAIKKAARQAEKAKTKNGLVEKGAAKKGSAQKGSTQKGSTQKGLAQKGLAQKGLAKNTSAKPRKAKVAAPRSVKSPSRAMSKTVRAPTVQASPIADQQIAA